MRCNVHELDDFVRAVRGSAGRSRWSCGRSTFVAVERRSTGIARAITSRIRTSCCRSIELVRVSGRAARLAQRPGRRAVRSNGLRRRDARPVQGRVRARREPRRAGCASARSVEVLRTAAIRNAAVGNGLTAGASSGTAVEDRAAIARRRASAGVPRALEEPVHPPPRRDAVLLWPRTDRADGGVPDGVELAGDAIDSRRAPRGALSRLLPAFDAHARLCASIDRRRKALPLSQNGAPQRSREWWARIDRRLGGVPNRIWRPLKGSDRPLSVQSARRQCADCDRHARGRKMRECRANRRAAANS